MGDTNLPSFLIEADAAIMKDNPHLEYLTPITVEGVGQFIIVPGRAVPVYPEDTTSIFDEGESFLLNDEPSDEVTEESTTKPAKGKKS